MHSSTLTKIKTFATAAATALLAAPAFGADYSFELLPGQAPFSIATGINNHGIVVGLCREGVCGIGPALEGSVGFVDDGTFRPVSGKVPTTLAGSPVNGGIISLNGINDHGVAAGAVSPGPADYGNGLVDNNGKFLAFLVSGMTGTRPTGINNNGKIVGYTMTIDGPTHGFIRNASGTITVFDAVAGHATLPTGINNAGLIVGAYGSFRPIASIFVDGPDSSFGNASTGFIRMPGGSIVTFAVPGAAETFPAGINDFGEIVGNYTLTVNGTMHGFLRYAFGQFVALDAPGATQTEIAGINNHGELVGTAWDANNNPQVFIARPRHREVAER